MREILLDCSGRVSDLKIESADERERDAYVLEIEREENDEICYIA